MTDTELEQRLRAFYRADVPSDEGAPAALRSMVSAIPQVSPAPLRRIGSGRGIRLLAVAALLTSAAIGTALLAGGPVDVPHVVVASNAPSGAPSPNVQATDDVADAGVIVYTRWKSLRDGEEDCTTPVFCHRANAYVSNDDGSNERVLVTGDYAYVLAASQAGPTVLVRRRDAQGDTTYLTDVSGSPLQVLDTNCQAPCVEDWYGFTFSPDGRRLAWVRTLADERSVIATMDMATGAVFELASTAGIAARPSWSSDGSQLVFANQVVDADGTDLRQFAPADLFRGTDGEFSAGLAAPQMSPDGTLIAFASFHDRSINGNSQRLSDIYVVRPDGAGLRRLTTDTLEPLGPDEVGDFGASFPAWTRDGRITFSRYPTPSDAAFELWVMDRDGSNRRQLDPSDAAMLTALGCVACAYPATNGLDLGLPAPIGFWVPAR